MFSIVSVLLSSVGGGRSLYVEVTNGGIMVNGHMETTTTTPTEERTTDTIENITFPQVL